VGLQVSLHCKVVVSSELRVRGCELNSAREGVDDAGGGGVEGSPGER
jgi:hypothetical protein